jgi:Uma2 family endonuclease
MTPEDHRKQDEAHRKRARNPRLRFGRIRVPPTLIIESVSIGHEDHDRETKRQWYAEAGVPNYWIISAFERSLECLKLVNEKYEIDAAGRAPEQVRPSLFPGACHSTGRAMGVVAISRPASAGAGRRAGG